MKENKQYDIDRYNWWHTIEFPNGQVTKGQTNYLGSKADRFLMPKKLTGKSVIDFGCWDGFWSIEAKKRGAASVLATDRFDPMFKTTELALGAWDIPYIYSGNLDEPLEVDLGLHDIVLFYGILYHLKNPFMGIWNAKKCCKQGGLIIVETVVDVGKMQGIESQAPLIHLVDVPYNKDSTNYCVPNEPGMYQLAKHMGLEIVSKDRTTPHRFTLLCRKA